jgi:pleiotropic regulator 1
MVTSEVSQNPTPLNALVLENAAVSKQLYTRAPERSNGKRQKPDDALEDPSIKRRFHAEYAAVETLPAVIAAKQPGKQPGKKVVKAGAPQRPAQKLLEAGPGSAPSTGAKDAGNAAPEANVNISTSLTMRGPAGATSIQQVRPEWHPPWKLMRVISGHLGWVRSLAVEPGNKWFASGAGDRTIKIWDLATGSLRLTLTGHISTVRGLAVSPRHPYLFSCGEDKMVKCWDLETNKVIRHYHGHLSGVYTLALHPTLDVLVTGGRDGVARVWDMRTRSQVHVLTGHTQTVSDLKCQEADPQVITGSLDSTVRMWDLAAGKTMGVLTHHKKGVRALATHPTEFTFASGSTGSIKQWKCPEGAFMQNFEGHNAIINTLSVNQNNVFFSGGELISTLPMCYVDL